MLGVGEVGEEGGVHFSGRGGSCGGEGGRFFDGREGMVLRESR